MADKISLAKYDTVCKKLRYGTECKTTKTDEYNDNKIWVSTMTNYINGSTAFSKPIYSKNGDVEHIFRRECNAETQCKDEYF